MLSRDRSMLIVLINFGSTSEQFQSSRWRTWDRDAGFILAVNKRSSVDKAVCRFQTCVMQGPARLAGVARSGHLWILETLQGADLWDCRSGKSYTWYMNGCSTLPPRSYCIFLSSFRTAPCCPRYASLTQKRLLVYTKGSQYWIYPWAIRAISILNKIS